MWSMSLKTFSSLCIIIALMLHILSTNTITLHKILYIYIFFLFFFVRRAEQRLFHFNDSFSKLRGFRIDLFPLEVGGCREQWSRQWAEIPQRVCFTECLLLMQVRERLGTCCCFKHSVKLIAFCTEFNLKTTLQYLIVRLSNYEPV
jgi:hypothetical protein